MFSNFSYLLLFAFAVLHAVGAHYTYSHVPLGDWVRDALGLARNHYDRVVHFSSGLLLAYPVREWVRRRLHVHGSASYVVPVALLLATSALYEIAEHQAARVVDPDLGLAFVGAQGDEWDAQKDMGLALCGSIAGMGLTALYRARTGREPWGLLH